MAESDEGRRDPLLGTVIQWTAAVLALLVAAVFLSVQVQQPSGTFGKDPHQPAPIVELYSVTSVPAADELNDLLEANRIVRADGAAARIDDAKVLPLLEQYDVRLLVLPYGVSAKRTTAIIEALDTPDHPTVVVQGLEGHFGGYAATPGDWVELENTLLAGEATGAVIDLIKHVNGDRQSAERAIPQVTWREPTDAELDSVAADLADDSMAVIDGATAFPMPATVEEAFADGAVPLVVVSTTPGDPSAVPRYADALAERFPDRVIVTVTGRLVDIAGAGTEGFRTALNASFYGTFVDDLMAGEMAQGVLLAHYLRRTAEFRLSGIFDRPMPYVPTDPLDLTLPALPWVSLGLAGVFTAMSIRRVRDAASASPADPPTAEQLSELAGLSALSIEVSGLVDTAQRRRFARAASRLTAARDAIEDGLPSSDVQSDLDAARELFTAVADDMDRPDLRPEAYVDGRWT